MSLWNKPMQSAGHIAVVMSCGGKTDRDDTGYAAGSEFSDLRYVFLTGESYGSSGNGSGPWSAYPAALHDGSGRNLDSDKSKNNGGRDPMSHQ